MGCAFNLTLWSMKCFVSNGLRVPMHFLFQFGNLQPVCVCARFLLVVVTSHSQPPTICTSSWSLLLLHFRQCHWSLVLISRYINSIIYDWYSSLDDRSIIYCLVPTCPTSLSWLAGCIGMWRSYFALLCLALPFLPDHHQQLLVCRPSLFHLSSLPKPVCLISWSSFTARKLKGGPLLTHLSFLVSLSTQMQLQVTWRRAMKLSTTQSHSTSSSIDILRNFRKKKGIHRCVCGLKGPAHHRYISRPIFDSPCIHWRGLYPSRDTA